MKKHTLTTTSLLAVVLMAGTYQAGADQQRRFGFTGEVDSFNRGEGALVVEDRLFHISESTLVHKKRGAKGTLSDITLGAKIGFYPGTGGPSYVSEIWMLPDNWKGVPGNANRPGNLIRHD